MKKIKNYKNRFIPIVAKADLIKNFPGKFKQLQTMKLNNKPCLVINKNKEIKESKNWTAQNEIDKIKEIIPNIEEYPVNLGKKNLINELIKIQYNVYKENFRDIVENIKREIKKNKIRLEELPQDFDLKDNKEVAEEIKECKKKISILTSSLTEIEKAHEKFYKDDPEIQEDENEKEKKVEENQEEIKEEEKNENNSDNEEN